MHSLNRFVFTVPSLNEAEKFYKAFGLEVRRSSKRIGLYTHGHAHCWGSIFEAPGRKKLQYLSFGAYESDLADIIARLETEKGLKPIAAHPLSDGTGHWYADPEGIAIQICVAPKVTPSDRLPTRPSVTVAAGRGASPARSAVSEVQPIRLSHVLLFSADVRRATRFYCDTLGLRVSDTSGDGIAFLHGPHASDHHLLAFAKSDGPGLHHASWSVDSLDQVGNGMEQMYAAGYGDGWGVGRHVLGSNYFYYVRDPWGSFCEYSFDIDFVPATLEWASGDHPPEDTFYLWGPKVPEYFIQNHETASASAPVATSVVAASPTASATAKV